MHAAAAAIAGMPILAICDEEADHLAGAIAKALVLSSHKRAEAASKRIEKSAPWLNLVLILSALYGPRVFILWRAAQAQKAQPKPSIVRPIDEVREMPADPAVN